MPSGTPWRDTAPVTARVLVPVAEVLPPAKLSALPVAMENEVRSSGSSAAGSFATTSAACAGAGASAAFIRARGAAGRAAPAVGEGEEEAAAPAD